MPNHVDSEQAKPGVSREQRVSSEGLIRLEKQLRAGVKINQMVLDQWVKRYGDDARKIIKDYKK